MYHKTYILCGRSEANHNTDMGSLLFCASILARLAAPLVYHFLLLINAQGTTFQQFYGQINVVPVLGDSFNEKFPMFVFVCCLFNVFNVYSTALRFLTFGGIGFTHGASEGNEDL